MPADLTAEQILERLVSFDTTSRVGNRPLVEFLADYLDRPGVRVDPLGEGPKLNLLVRIGPESDREDGLTVSGHTDTVPADEPG